MTLAIKLRLTIKKSLNILFPEIFQRGREETTMVPEVEEEAEAEELMETEAEEKTVTTETEEKMVWTEREKRKVATETDVKMEPEEGGEKTAATEGGEKTVATEEETENTIETLSKKKPAKKLEMTTILLKEKREEVEEAEAEVKEDSLMMVTDSPTKIKERAKTKEDPKDAKTRPERTSPSLPEKTSPSPPETTSPSPPERTSPSPPANQELRSQTSQKPKQAEAHTDLANENDRSDLSINEIA